MNTKLASTEYRRPPWKGILAGLALGYVAVYPVLIGNYYTMHVFTMFFIWATVASCWNLMLGYAGVMSLGNIGFFGVGAYVSAILSKKLLFSPWITIPLAGLFTAVVVTCFLGLPALRVSGVYIALLTLAFADALPSVLTSARVLTGGPTGLHDISRFFPGAQPFHVYYICFVMFIAMHVAIYRIVRSTTGLAFVALRDAEHFAASLGVDRYKERVKVFALSSFLTGIAGGFYAHAMGDISPATLGIEPFMMVMAMIQLGGIGTLMGPVLGSLILVFGNEFLRLMGTSRLAMLGGLICAVILFFPGGIAEAARRLESWAERICARRLEA
jgi:branched-chain amino acid transport system permease protein